MNATLPVILCCLLAGAVGLGRASEGDRDPGFGDDGIAVLSPPVADLYRPMGPIVQQDGRILACARGLSADGTRYSQFVHRLDGNGEVDISFGESGRVDLGGESRACVGLGLQTGDKIVVAYVANGNGTVPAHMTEVRIVRLDVSGRPDPIFGAAGTAYHRLPAGAVPSGMAIQADGAIVLGFDLFPNRLGLARIRTDGSADTQFGSNGRMEIEFPSAMDAILSLSEVRIDGHQRILAIGTFDFGTEGAYEFIAARVLYDGRADTSFGTGGRVAISFPGSSAYARKVLLQNDGRIILAGHAYQPAQWVGPLDDNIAVVRLNENGALDPSFGEGGRKVISIDLIENGTDAVRGGLIRSDGKLVLVGTAASSLYPYAQGLLLQLEEDGDVDVTFGANGVLTFDVIEGDQWESFYGIEMQGSSYIVLGNALDFYDQSLQFVVRIQGNAEAVLPVRSTRLLPFPATRVRRPVP